MNLPALPEGYSVRMLRHEEAVDLRTVGADASGREAFLVPSAAAAWKAMRDAAGQEGVSLLLISAFRSRIRQQAILEGKVASGTRWTTVLETCAYPGYSEHHTGRAIDLGAPDCAQLEERFEETAQFGWLRANAVRFGFSLTYPRHNRFGIAYEPWHWCFQA